MKQINQDGIIPEIEQLIANFLHCDIRAANLYIMLLREPKSEKSIFYDCSLSAQKLANCLDVLIANLLIADFTARDKSKVYFAVDPQASFPAIILTEMWKTDTSLHTIAELLERNDLLDLNNRYKICKIIVANLKKLYNKQLPFLKEMVVVISGYKRIASYIAQLLETARVDIYAVISPPHLLGEIVWQALVEKMSLGIIYHRVTTFSEILRHGYEISKKEISNYNEVLYICKNDALPDKFYVINDFMVVFFIPNRESSDFKFEVHVMKNAEFSKRYKDTYERLRNESYNLADIIEKIGQYRKHFLEIVTDLTEEEREWLADIFDFGVFYNRSKHEDDVVSSAIDKCLKKGIVNINDKDDVLAKYSLREVLS
jgi:hypothetical protein